MCLSFCCLGGGRVFFCFAVWAGGVFLFCRLGGGVFFFCCLSGGVFFFLLFGPGTCFFFAVWAGDGSSLTYPSAWLVFKRPNNKRDRTAKKNTGSASPALLKRINQSYIMWSAREAGTRDKVCSAVFPQATDCKDHAKKILKDG